MNDVDKFISLIESHVFQVLGYHSLNHTPPDELIGNFVSRIPAAVTSEKVVTINTANPDYNDSARKKYCETTSNVPR